MKTNYGFNRKNFVEDILNTRFDGNEKACAHALGVNTRYLKNLIYHTDKNIGLKTMNKIRLYCLRNNLNHEKYTLV